MKFCQNGPKSIFWSFYAKSVCKVRYQDQFLFCYIFAIFTPRSASKVGKCVPNVLICDDGFPFYIVVTFYSLFSQYGPQSET